MAEPISIKELDLELLKYKQQLESERVNYLRELYLENEQLKTKLEAAHIIIDSLKIENNTMKEVLKICNLTY